MKLVGLTLRVDLHKSINERRDAIDQRWYFFLKECGLFPVLLPNFEDSINFIKKLSLVGVILTGGNSIKGLGGDAPERDDFEFNLIKYTIQGKLPLFGVCRGMQIIQHFFKEKIEQIPNHVGNKHKIRYLDKSIEVNSYHNYGSYDCSSSELEVVGRSNDNIVEAIAHKSLPIKGIMWHPEREKVMSSLDISILKNHFNI